LGNFRPGAWGLELRWACWEVRKRKATKEKKASQVRSISENMLSLFFPFCPKVYPPFLWRDILGNLLLQRDT
jgi:hypothetical protein